MYNILTKLDIDENQYAILDYLMYNYKQIMTPNACRILCYLLDHNRFSIQELISRGWKPSALYKNTNKLEQNQIIIREGGDDCFMLSSIIKEATINSDKITIATYNFNDYKNKTDKESRLAQFKKIVNVKSILSIQDFKVGKDGKWAKKLAGDNYKIILPNQYIENDCESMVAMLLINHNVFEHYEELVLGEDMIFSLRYTYGRLTLKNGKKFRILNLYIPQSYNKEQERKLEIKRFWKIIIEEVRRCRIINEEFIVLGDLNAFDGEESENRSYFIRLNDIMIDVFEDALKCKPDWRYTWVSEDGKTKRRLDYIFVNSNVVYNNTLACKFEDASLKGISDHKMIQLELK